MKNQGVEGAGVSRRRDVANMFSYEKYNMKNKANFVGNSHLAP